MKKMRFENPVLHRGLNFTVRLGDWEDLEVGEIIELEAPVWCLGMVTHIIKCYLGEIPEFVLKKEHDPDCRTFDGLVTTLKEIYPELQGKAGEEVETEVVTCVGFQVFVALGGENKVLQKEDKK